MGGKGDRRYGDDVPEDIKAELSKGWAAAKAKTYAAAEKHGMKTEVGDSFNKVVVFDLEPGLYHFTAGMVSVCDVSVARCDIGELCSSLINEMAAKEKKAGCTPLAASNVCDWDSKYAKRENAHLMMRGSIINACINNDIILTGGETANLGDQVRQTGMGWTFALVSRYDKDSPERFVPVQGSTDNFLKDTFSCFADGKNYEVVERNGMFLLHIKKRGRYILTADGTGSKSIVCDQINKRTDAYCTAAMCCDDGTREGAFPVLGIYAVHLGGKGYSQIIDNIKEVAMRHHLPVLGGIIHRSNDVEHYIMNGVVLSEVREEGAHIGKKIEAGTPLVVLYEEQRSNGISTQRKMLTETFGERWYGVKASEAFEHLNKKLGNRYDIRLLRNPDRTLGELVAQPCTPYFRADSQMRRDLLQSIQFRINVSSGGLFGKTRRLLEPFGLGAEYKNLFEAPDLVKLLQMASQIEGSKGLMPDENAYYTWGCGNGEVIGTTRPQSVIGYYKDMGIAALEGGFVTANPEIVIMSRCLDSLGMKGDHILRHPYTEKPLDER